MKETLEFNHKKQCGLWLILIGIVLITSEKKKKKKMQKVVK